MALRINCCNARRRPKSSRAIKLIEPDLFLFLITDNAYIYILFTNRVHILPTENSQLCCNLLRLYVFSTQCDVEPIYMCVCVCLNV